jgi:hypothetical protein
MTPLLLTLAFAVCSVIVSTVNAQVGCRNAAGTSVDWWIALKVRYLTCCDEGVMHAGCTSGTRKHPAGS